MTPVRPEHRIARPRRTNARRAASRVSALALALCLAVPLARAIADDGEPATPPPTGVSPIESGGFLEIGAGVAAGRPGWARADPADDGAIVGGVTVLVSGAWRRGRLFFEGRRGGLDGVSLGVTLWNDERHVLDALGVHVPGAVGIGTGDDDDGAPPGEASRDLALVQRESVFGTSGLRLRRYDGPRLLQLSLVADWSNGNGVLAGVHAGRQWQFGNWSVEGVAGFRYAGAALIDYLYGVDADEATARFGAYRAPASGVAEADLTLSRPLGQHWVFRTHLRARRFEDGIDDSPLVVARDTFTAETGLHYVF